MKMAALRTRLNSAIQKASAPFALEWPLIRDLSEVRGLSD